MHHLFKPNALRLAAAAVFGVAATAVAPSVVAQDPGKYAIGDFHNHTTCSDGQISVQRLVNKSVDVYGLDWFILAGHGGGGTRNCNLADSLEVAEASGVADQFPFVPGQGPTTSWNDSIGNAAVKGDPRPGQTKAEGYMWRWQSIQEFQYPVLEAMAEAKQKPIFIGLESVVAGHEHADQVITDGQLPAGGGGNATPVAQWEYCFDRADSDLSRGADNQWDCSVPGSERNALLDPRGLKLAGASAVNGNVNQNNGTAGHLKTVEGVKWMQAFHPETSFYIPAHVERAGVFNPNGNNGFNIEHFRNFNNAGPTVAFGMEGGPGHQANSNRSYGSSAAGRGTYGGAGYYMGKLGGVWDTLLGEGRNFWIFNNSDYHARGGFGPDDVRSTNDQYPGEFNKSYTITKTGGAALTPKDIVDGMRTGNSYYVNGDLIDKMSYVVCKAKGKSQGKGSLPHEQQVIRAAEAGIGFENPNCAQQGEKLVIQQGDSIQIMVVLRDPEGSNLAPYTIPNPSLAQVGINIPLNTPKLDHVDVITGLVTGYIAPTDARYAGAAPGGAGGAQDSPNTINPSTQVVKVFNQANWKDAGGGWKHLFHRIDDVQASQYVRLRGTNIPAATPFETDANGEPLVDNLVSAITVFPDATLCADAAQLANNPNCLAHLPAQTDASGRAGRRLDVDVEAWTDLWFYSNPVYIEVQGGQLVAGVK